MNNENKFEYILLRMNKIERNNKKLRLINNILITLIFLSFLIAWQTQSNFFKVIETEKVIIKDNKGIERAVLYHDNLENITRFRMKNEKGDILSSYGSSNEVGGFIWLSDFSEKEKKSLYLSANQVNLELNEKFVLGWGFNKEGSSYFQVGADKDMHSVYLNDKIYISDEINAVRVGIFANSELYNGAELVLRAPAHYTKVDSLYHFDGGNMPVNELLYGMAETKLRIVATENSVFQSFYDNDGNEQVVISSNDDGSRQISFLNSDKKYIQSMFVNKDNDCGYRIYDNNENLRVAIGNISLMKNGNDYKTGISSVNLFNSAGNIIFTTEE